MKERLKLMASAAVTAAATAATHPASAAALAGGIDPGVGLTGLGSWMLTIVGVAIPVICAWKGTHAVAEGRHLGPYVGSAIGGMGLAFGASYILTHYGVA
jgi:hypothetical protein